MTTALILLPLIAGLIVGLAPLERRMTEGLALLAVLVECALGVIVLIQFDADKGTQFVTDKVWITDFLGIADVRFHVGMGGLSLFMVLLTPSAWPRRPRPPHGPAASARAPTSHCCWGSSAPWCCCSRRATSCSSTSAGRP